MEHSTLHALQLTGLVLASGGVFFVLALLFPAARSLGSSQAALAAPLEENARRWAVRGAAVAALATFLDLFVQVAEVEAKTIFGGVSFAEVFRFVTTTTVGQLGIARVATLFLAALALIFLRRSGWWPASIFAAASIVLTSMVSHAAAQPEGRAFSLALQMVHITAASIWIGALLHALASRRAIEAATSHEEVTLISEVVRRLSPIALCTAFLLFASGVIAAYRYLLTPGAVLSSAYGLTLLVKLVLLVPVLVAGFTNFRFVRPALFGLARAKEFSVQQAGETLRRFGRMLELEVTAGILVIAVAGVLGSVSPPREDASLLLTQGQASALLLPALPRAQLIDPAVFYGEPTRAVEDLLYAEFTHNWSGVMVTLLGFLWLLQSFGGRAGSLAARVWPFLMLPFAAFIAVAADPEVWILRRLSWAQALRDPQILEHNFGAALMLLIIWLGWRDRKRPEVERPLGYPLPAIMILGSLLLLGHAHSNLADIPELTTPVNVQHAVIGAFGLFAGVVRWLSLRGLFPQRVAQILWPACVMAVGIALGFFYQEFF